MELRREVFGHEVLGCTIPSPAPRTSVMELAVVDIDLSGQVICGIAESACRSSVMAPSTAGTSMVACGDLGFFSVTDEAGSKNVDTRDTGDETRRGTLVSHSGS